MAAVTILGAGVYGGKNVVLLFNVLLTKSIVQVMDRMGPIESSMERLTNPGMDTNMIF